MNSFEELRLEKQQQAQARQLDELITAFQRQDYATAGSALEKIAAGGIASPELWMFRKFFLELPEHITENSPLLLAGRGMVHILGHNVDKANACVHRLRALCVRCPGAAASYLLACLELLLPLRTRPTTALRSAARALHQAQTAQTAQPSSKSQPPFMASRMAPFMTLTANRPSVFSGLLDFSAYHKHLGFMHRQLDAVLHDVYGTASQAAADMIVAEHSYQNSRYVEAFSLATSAVNILTRTEQGADILFAAMFLVLEVLVVTGQTKANEAVVFNMRDKFIEMQAFHLLPSVTALHMWVLLYTDDKARLQHWLEHEAPDENGDYSLLDNFAYFVKLRVYLAFGKYLQAVGLIEKLRPVLTERGKIQELCELDILLAMTCHQQGDHKQAEECLQRCLPLGKKYGYYRLFADEGELMHSLLCRYTRHKKPDKTPFLNATMEQSLEMALLYPQYLKPWRSQTPQLTRKQLVALRLAEQFLSTEQIAEKMQVSKATVTGYFRRIFANLGVKNRHQAVAVAKALHLLD